MNKTESYCYQKYKSSSNNSCVIKEKNIVGKNLLEGTYYDGNGIPKMIGITKTEYLEYKQLQQENQQLKRYCNIGNENLNFYREEYNKLEHNWKKLKEYCEEVISIDNELYGTDLLDKMAELEQKSDSDE